MLKIQNYDVFTRDVQNELLIVLYLDIYVGHVKNPYIPI